MDHIPFFVLCNDSVVLSMQTLMNINIVYKSKVKNESQIYHY